MNKLITQLNVVASIINSGGPRGVAEQRLVQNQLNELRTALSQVDNTKLETELTDTKILVASLTDVKTDLEKQLADLTEKHEAVSGQIEELTKELRIEKGRVTKLTNKLEKAREESTTQSD